MGKNLFKRSSIPAVTDFRGDEMNYHSFFHSSPDLLFVLDLNGTIIEVNKTAAEKLQYNPSDMHSRSIFQMRPAELRKDAEKCFNEMLSGKRSYCPHPLETKSGLLLSVETRITRGKWNGKDAIFSVSKDVTEQRQAEEASRNVEDRYRLLLSQSEEKYRKIFENIQDIFYQADIEGKIIEISPSIERYSGYKPEELIGMKIENVYLNPADRGGLVKALQEKGEIEDYIIKLRTKDKREVFVSANVHLLFGSDGRPSGVEGSLRDVSERINSQEKLRSSEQLLRNQNEELKSAKEKAEESDRLKSAFLANMSHEIRTPMNGILGFSIMLADATLPEETRNGYVKIVNSSCEQLLHIVNDIIDISKIESGQIDLSESAFDLDELLDEAISFYSPSAEANGVNLVKKHLHGSSIAHPLIISDRIRMRQILDNLLSNAVKFTPSGSIILRYGVMGDFLMFEIEDTGIGIQQEMQDVIFERFRQVETSYTKKYGGTGLGLSITKAYVEKMGGEITVRSELGNGSIFCLQLPYKSAVKMEKSEEAAGIDQPVNKDTVILVVEDEEINWFYLYEILKNNAKIFHASNGEMAIDFINNHPETDIVLMDIKLPDINGLDLTRTLKTIKSDLRVIAQSAYALTGDREKALLSGCSDYITKPVNKSELLNLISAHSGIKKEA